MLDQNGIIYVDLEKIVTGGADSLCIHYLGESQYDE